MSRKSKLDTVRYLAKYLYSFVATDNRSHVTTTAYKMFPVEGDCCWLSLLGRWDLFSDQSYQVLKRGVALHVVMPERCFEVTKDWKTNGVKQGYTVPGISVWITPQLTNHVSNVSRWAWSVVGGRPVLGRLQPSAFFMCWKPHSIFFTGALMARAVPRRSLGGLLSNHQPAPFSAPVSSCQSPGLAGGQLFTLSPFYPLTCFVDLSTFNFISLSVSTYFLPKETTPY
ncbi:hypothetical protein F4778DRAFT_473438 [Xylariomycetidae sp. FL2044]|nr:hypothetical protein F4778DRAFT_473438 [Xylariomycetidae sp. FL2044]